MTYKPEGRLYVNLLFKENILSDIKNDRYSALLSDKATLIRFLIIIKSKNAMFNKNKIFFKKIVISTVNKMWYFKSNNARKYKLLVLYFEKKDFIYEKSALFLQNQNRIIEKYICSIINRACIIRINI